MVNFLIRLYVYFETLYTPCKSQVLCYSEKVHEHMKVFVSQNTQQVSVTRLGLLRQGRVLVFVVPSVDFCIANDSKLL